MAIAVTAHAASTDISTDPLNTYSAATSTDVKPNVFFVLDDSGSMDWDFMPDWACASYSTTDTTNCGSAGQNPSSARSEYLFRNSSYNGVYYNPATSYKPPVAIDSTGALNTTTYLSMTGVSATTGGDSTATASNPNWKAVKDDAFGVQATTKSNLQDATKPPYFFVTVAGEYCTSPALRTCVTSNVPTTVSGVAYNYPAPLRWCDSSALTNCRAAFGSGFTYARAPAPSIATITVSGSSSGSVSNITVNGVRILANTTSASSSSSTVAANIAAQINACNTVVGSTCGALGFRATSSGSVVTIVAPTPMSYTPAVTGSGMTFTATAFASNSVPGKMLGTVIAPNINSYPYPGSTTKAASRTDCAGSTCTYAEEMTNYANWWAYYRTRMQMMKSSASNAFASLDSATDMTNGVSRFRLGYMSINNNTRADYLNLGEFSGTQKYNWFQKLISANPSNSTPLRVALATAGQLYAGKLNGQTLNGSTVTDPLQYSCQQNYTILSTDGFWNESSTPTQMDKSTAVGNQDSGWSRPYFDGGTAQLQMRTSTLQIRTGTLQQGTSSWRGTSWTNVSTCTPSGSVQCRYNWGTWTNASSCNESYSSGSSKWTISNGTDCQYTTWTVWSNASACTDVAQSAGPNYTVGTARQCAVNATSGTSNTLSDVAAYYYGNDLRNSDTTKGTGTCVGPIIPPSTTPTDLCADNVPANGRDTATAQHMTTFTLGLGSQGQMIYAPEDGKDYWNDKSGDFFDVLKGNAANPSQGICSWQSSGNCNWPTPVSNANTTIDDLWHAAVNGHGTYFSAKDPDSLSSSLLATLRSISNTPRPGTAAAAASSNPNVSAGDNFVFSTSYKSVDWYGELIRQQISDSGVLSAQNWSAMRLVDCATTTWQPSTNYIVGQVFRQGASCYVVTAAYTSGTAFDGAGTGLDGGNTAILNVDENATNKTALTAPTSRTIYTKGTVNGSPSLIPFTWSSLVSAGLDSNFTAPHITYVSDSVGLSQFCASGGNCLSAAAQSNNTIATGGAAGEALVNYLRGDRTYEGSYFRQRAHVLGDIVSSEARYVKAPLLSYNDAGYADFKTAMGSRAGAVYVGSNDGMVHAFDGTTGVELWAYVPSMMLPKLYALADKNYATKHQFFVDNSPETGDICPNAPASTCTGAQWKTILVGGFNRGGNGYYALDITNPASPKLLWEFTDANMGYSYSNPQITKLADGTWVVMVASGYNNADGVGRLYVLNANTGALIRTISTGAGSAASPSGLSRISAHVPQAAFDNTTVAVYGGDLLGDLWRFDVNNNIGAAGYDAQLLVKFTDASNNPQPVTTKPVLTTVGSYTLVYVGTGRYLGTTDVTDTSMESFYAVLDRSDQTTYGNPRNTSSKFVQQTMTSTTCPANTAVTWCNPGQIVRTSSNNAVDYGVNNGWYIDFLTAGERSISDATLGLGTLLFTTITPQSATANACTATAIDGSGSFLYALNYLNGGPVDGSNGVVAVNMGSYFVTKPVMLELGNNNVVALTRVSNGQPGNGTDGGSTSMTQPPIAASAGEMRRVSWRVLNGQ
jgi:type IV pilus assembly protein PilY1